MDMSDLGFAMNLTDLLIVWFTACALLPWVAPQLFE